MMVQKQKVGGSGSFVNQMMGNNSTEPKAGEFATIMHYTDRSVVLVKEVKPNGNVVLQRCRTEADRSKRLVEGHQDWIHIPVEGTEYTIKYSRGKWREIFEYFELIMPVRTLKAEFPEVFAELYPDNSVQPVKEIAGFSKKKTSYQPISIIFGIADYYYDWSF
jgi:hypothetical protein